MARFCGCSGQLEALRLQHSAMPARCQKCGREFTHPWQLRRHLERIRPCHVLVGTPPGHVCEKCGKTFASRRNQLRHTAGCSEGAAGFEARLEAKFEEFKKEVRASAVNVTHTTVVGSNNSFISAGAVAIQAHRPGWPAGWAALADPEPFQPQRFIITQHILEAAAAGCTGSVLDSCRRGDPAAIGVLFVEIMKRVHATPGRQNIYVNPSRADQVLVYIPERWDVKPLAEAIEKMYSKVASDLIELSLDVRPPLREVAVQASTNYRENNATVVRSSRGAMWAHLSNARSGAVAEVCAAVEPVVFGAESQAHLVLDVPGTLTTLEMALQLPDAPEGLDPAALGALAAQAVVHVGRLVLHRHPENHTVFLIDPETAVVTTAAAVGWREMPAVAAGVALAEHMASRLASYLRHAGGQTPLQRLAPALDRDRAEVCAAAGPLLLDHYSRAAVAAYGALPLPAPEAKGCIPQARRYIEMRQARQSAPLTAADFEELGI